MLGSIVGVAVDATNAPAQNNLDHDEFGVGSLYMDSMGRIFRWVRVEDAALSAGDVVYPASGTASEWEVTNDVSGGSRVSDKVIGVAVAACDDGNYCFIQIAGEGVVDLTTSGSVTAGAHVIGNTSADGACVVGTAGTDDWAAFAIALAADDGNTLSAGTYILINNL